MATDSTELTFVRCPACRSLVPAMSSRCRMCGAGLDPVDEASEQVPAARERKKTVVYTPGVDLEEDAQVEALKAESEQATSDPLAGFVDEVSSEPEPVLEAATKPLDSLESESDPLAAMISEDIVDPIEPQAEVAPKVIIEQGRGKRGGLSFSEPEPQALVEEVAEAPAPKEDPLANLYDEEDSQEAGVAADPLMDFQEDSLETAEPSPVVPEPTVSEPVTEMVVEEVVEEVIEDEVVSSSAKASTSAEASSFAEAPEDKTADKEEKVFEAPKPILEPVQHAVPAATEAPKVSAGSSGLIGWLVSASSDDFIIELRGGKRFITGTKLKDADLVLDHPSVSTPHAMLLVADDGSCVVQDLMSDSGVFMRSSSQSDFTKTEERFELSHGQGIVFGELEFIVVLIPR